jgi:hypothetical protein
MSGSTITPRGQTATLGVVVGTLKGDDGIIV